MSNLATLGHNMPPDVIGTAKDALAELNGFLKENPVVQTAADAKQAGAWLERTRGSLKELEDDRTRQVGPLNAQVKKINDLFRAAREPLEKVCNELRRRLTAYTTAEELKRAAEAERLRLQAEAMAEAARQKAAAADDAIAGADVGELSDVGTAIADADAAIKAAGKADRAAARAERESTVRIASVMGGRALAPRTVTRLRTRSVEDACKALRAIGLTPEVDEFVCSLARRYEKQLDEWPDWIEVTVERSI